MSTCGHFSLDEHDIATLRAADCEAEATGWVNVGCHAVRIHLDAEGNLLVEGYALANEAQPLGSLTVTRAQAVLEGAQEPQADDAGDNGESFAREPRL